MMTWSWKKQEIAIRNISNSDYLVPQAKKTIGKTLII
jgi:hypothetical protein